MERLCEEVTRISCWGGGWGVLTIYTAIQQDDSLWTCIPASMLRILASELRMPASGLVIATSTVHFLCPTIRISSDKF